MVEGCKRSADEIKARMRLVEERDWLGTTRGDLVSYLSFADAKEFLRDGATEEQWNRRPMRPPLGAARDYLAFAWDKANNRRGLSAGRSLDHLKAWLWLAGYGDLVDQHFENYDRYGKKQLVIASELCGFEWEPHDDGSWVNSEFGEGLSSDDRQRVIEEARRIAAAAREGS